LENIGKHEAPLRSEIEFIRSYLEIENVRFSGAIQLETTIDPALLDAKIPSMVLQPLVENSVRHGYATRAQAGTIRIEAERRGLKLIIRVVDDGSGPRCESRPGGTGIPNTRARLEQLYAGDTTFRLFAHENGGAVAEMSIPFAV
jgi:LytS/YehU family sensor histidine kinase